MKISKGFTYIELVVVIVVLAILAVAAIPRYISLKQEANASVVESVAASFRYVVDSVQINAVIQGVEGQQNVPVLIEGIAINTYFGVPQEIWDERLGELFVGDITHVGNGYYDFGSNGVKNYECTDELCVIDQTPGGWIASGIRGWGMFLFPESYTLNDECYAYYAFEASSTEVVSLVTEAVTDGC
ncbi:prepilin-type N-terminal cleavage/methylation domain-containing protein [Vibrio sp. RE86]|uniref:prepilin-type N-terminal cleavage/methylation domain-containing protein n=1 Tax=Vibrio sp. RE86 TaxID=2607605 RepID=UPI001C11E3E6|nr:prepilin-type N-terminal cleavage/methylation domain-containing protein [Vibrio sp. RE86]